jgi:hypothetical protein
VHVETSDLVRESAVRTVMRNRRVEDRAWRETPSVDRDGHLSLAARERSHAKGSRGGVRHALSERIDSTVERRTNAGGAVPP